MAPSALQPVVADWTLLFNDPRFHALNMGKDERSLQLTAERDGRAAASLSGVVDAEGTFTSGHSAPFGGPDFARPRETPERIASLLDQLLEQAAAHGVRRVCLRLRPPSYSENEAVVTHTLLQRGFATTDSMIAYTVDLAGIRRLDDHLDRLRSSARRAVRQLSDRPFRFVAADDDATWDAAWAVIEGNRAAKGYHLALSGAYVREARRALGDRVRLWLLEHAGAPCAAALVYRVAPRRDLLVAWGDAGHDLPVSPMPLLAARVTGQTIAGGGELLDLGAATLPAPGRPINAGLAEFKRGVGGVAQPRLTLVKDLAWTTR